MNGYDFPNSWLRLKFTDVLEIQGGTQPPKSQFVNEPRSGYIRLLQIRDFGNKPVPTYIPDTKKLKKCSIDDVLIGRYGASIGRICSGMDGAYNVALAKVIKPLKISNVYIKHYLKSELFQQPLRLLSRSAQNGFNKDDLSNFDFVLPPLAEQKEISLRLESLLTQVEGIKHSIDKIPTTLKTFRQSVLADAVSGKLTEGWTDTEKIKYWQVVSLKNVADSFTYGTSAKSSKAGDVPVLRMGNIQNGNIDWRNLVYTSNINEIEKYNLESGDVLFNRTNSPELVGKTTIYRGERKAIYAGYLIRIRCGDKLNPEFLNILLNSPGAKEYCWQVKTDGVSQSNINAKKIAAYSFCLPPISEQVEIVSKVDQLFTFVDQVEQRLAEAQKRVNNLTQSILAKAFCGELTAEWREHNIDLITGENSAEALLELIKVEREKIAKEKKTKRKSTRKITGKKMKPKQIISVLEALKIAKKPLEAKELLDQAGYPNEADTGKMEEFFLDIREQLKSGNISCVRKGDVDIFEAVK